MIYHITAAASWEAQIASKAFSAESLENEGFIHACNAEQIAGVLDRYFKGMTDLLVLEIDESRLSAEIKYEGGGPTTELYPHVYGPIEKLAIVSIETVK